MNCTVCGSVIPDGQANCPVCGAPVNMAAPQQPMGGMPQMQQPIQPQGMPQQPMGGVAPQPMQPQQPVQPQPMQPQAPAYGQQPQAPVYGQQPMQPQQPMGGYAMPAGVATGKIGISDIIVLVGAFFLLLSPFLSWLSVSAFGFKVSSNLFKLGGGLYVISGIIFLVVAVALALMRLGNFVPALQPVKQFATKIPMPDVVVPAVALLFHIICFVAIKSEVKGELSGLAHMGAGWFIGLLAILVAACPAVLKMIGINLDEKIKL